MILLFQFKQVSTHLYRLFLPEYFYILFYNCLHPRSEIPSDFICSTARVYFFKSSTYFCVFFVKLCGLYFLV